MGIESEWECILDQVRMNPPPLHVIALIQYTYKRIFYMKIRPFVDFIDVEVRLRLAASKLC